MISQSRTIFSGGEDGFVRAWKPNETTTEGERDNEMHDEEGPFPAVKTGLRSNEKKKHKEEKRFKPY
jgi:hypothetical protein